MDRWLMSDGRVSVAGVCAFGALGGFAAWLLMRSTGGHLLPWEWYGAVPAAMFLGAMAAGMGVYVLANTDLTHVGRALFFAAICGAFFKPVFEGAGGFIGGAISQHRASATAREVADVTSRLTAAQSQPDTQVATIVTEAAEVTRTLVEQAAAIGDPRLKEQLETRSASAVDAIEAAAPTAPTAAIESLASIGTAAKASGQTDLTLRVLDSLDTVQRTTTDPRVLKQIREATAKIHTASPRP